MQLFLKFCFWRRSFVVNSLGFIYIEVFSRPEEKSFLLRIYFYSDAIASSADRDSEYSKTFKQGNPDGISVLETLYLIVSLLGVCPAGRWFLVIWDVPCLLSSQARWCILFCPIFGGIAVPAPMPFNLTSSAKLFVQTFKHWPVQQISVKEPMLVSNWINLAVLWSSILWKPSCLLCHVELFPRERTVELFNNTRF